MIKNGKKMDLIYKLGVRYLQITNFTVTDLLSTPFLREVLIKSAEIFPKMRNLTDEDLFTIAGHILLQPKIVSEKWGGGKIYY